METVGDAWVELTRIQSAIDALHKLRARGDSETGTCDDAICLLTNYKRTLCELHIQK